MDRYLQGIFMVLSLINPVICGALFSKITAAKPVEAKIADATRSILSIMTILCLAAVGGSQLLKTFGISLDAFQAAGGMVLVWMGFHMLRGNASPTTTTRHSTHYSFNKTRILTPLVSPLRLSRSFQI